MLNQYLDILIMFMSKSLNEQHSLVTIGDFVQGYSNVDSFEENLNIEIDDKTIAKIYDLPRFEQFMFIIEKIFPDYFGEMDWVVISSFKGLSVMFIETFSYLLHWKTLCSQQKFTIEFIKKHSHLMDKKTIMLSHFDILSNDIVDTLQWAPIENKRQKYKKTYFQNKLFEYIISTIEIDYPDDYKNLDFNAISRYRYLSEDFIDHHFTHLNIKNVCTVQRLTMNIVIKYSNDLDYNCMSITQANNIDISYILDNKDKFDMEKIKKNITVPNGISSSSEEYMFQILALFEN